MSPFAAAAATATAVALSSALQVVLRARIERFEARLSPASLGDLLLSLWSADRKAVLFVTHDLEEAIALSDRVVVMSAGPASRIVAQHTIDLPRPRETTDIRLDPRFHALQRAIWSDLKSEVMKAYGDQFGEIAS